MDRLTGIIYVMVITVLPWIELRGSIPIGIGLGLNPLVVFIVALGVNIAIIFPAFLFLKWFFHIIEKNRIAKRFIDRTRSKAKPYVERYGMVGLAIFVGIPLPGTGAYSGALAAHLFGMRSKRAILSISMGVLMAGLVITLASTIFKETLGWLLRFSIT